MSWVAHDINKRGGLLVDGKTKKIQIIKGNDQSKPAITKKIVEQLCLEDKVDVLWGCSGSHLGLIVQQTAGKYKVIYTNPLSVSDELMGGKNFNRYSFRTCLNATMFGDAMAYFYSKRPENKFYILCQDYMYGHSMANAFKQGLAKYKPNAEILGEDYHQLFLKDFAPYLTKIKASNAEVLFTADWDPDSGNLLKHARQLGMNIPIANLYLDNPSSIATVGGPAGVGIVRCSDHLISIDTPENRFINKEWNKQSMKWKTPYKGPIFNYPETTLGRVLVMGYWLVDVIKRAESTNAEKIIETWEGDVYKSITGIVKMRAHDHQVVRDLYVSEYKYPNEYYENIACPDTPVVIPAEKCTSPVPTDLKRADN